MKSVWIVAVAAAGTFGGCDNRSSTPGTSDHGLSRQNAPVDESVDISERAAMPDAPVVISTQSAQAIGLTIATAGPATVREILPLYGTIKLDSARVRTITARYPGIVKMVSKNVGDRVRQGESLARVESSDSLETYVLTSPISGVVTARMTNPGENAGTDPLLTIADFSKVWADLTLFPRDRGDVRVGQTVAIVASDGALRTAGLIALVGTLGPAGDQTLLARVLIANDQGLWSPGQFVTGEVVIHEELVPIAVQNEALQTVDDRPIIFVQRADGFVPRPVKFGRQDSRNSQVTEGLAAGERYAASGSFVLKAELGKREMVDED